MSTPDPNNPTCFEAFQDLGKQKQWELYRDAKQQRDEIQQDAIAQSKYIQQYWTSPAEAAGMRRETERLERENHRQRVKLKNRAAMIVELWQGMEAARRWLKGELRDTELGDPAPKSWFCAYCGKMIHGGREASTQHAQQCSQNPLVQRIQALKQQLRDLKATE